MNSWKAALRRNAYLGIAPALCLVLYWRVFFTWFLNDDFAWLGLPYEVSSPRDLQHVFFAPAAQGTVRVFSERLFFLIFSGLFGFHPVPYRIWVFATWFADLTLATWIGSRLTGSRVAGTLAVVLWTTSVSLLVPLTWASAYNQILCAFFLLAAFSARLKWLETGQRKWAIVECVAYLAGFGALEVTVMYPVLALLYSLTSQPGRRRGQALAALPLFIPAILFSAVHFALVPRTFSPAYVLKVDGRLPFTFLHYLGWATGFSNVEPGSPWPLKDVIVPICVTLALLVFIITRLRRREFIALFYAGWFLALLAPLLPLPNHITEYYLAIPVLGLAWLGGWAMVTAWQTGVLPGLATAGLIFVFWAGSAHTITVGSRWYRERAAKMRTVVLGIREEARVFPGKAFVLEGIDDFLYRCGFEDDPFRLFGIDRLYFAPDAQGVQPSPNLILDRFRIGPDHALALLQAGQARALSYSSAGLHDVTPQYEAMLIASSASVRHDFVDAGDPLYSFLLGPTWYPPERKFRWMPRSATVHLSAPRTAGSTLHVTGFAPEPLFGNGPPSVRFLIGTREVGSATLQQPQGFDLNFPIPEEFSGAGDVELTIEVSKTIRAAGELRDLGMIFGTFEIRPGGN